MLHCLEIPWICRMSGCYILNLRKWMINSWVCLFQERQGFVILIRATVSMESSSTHVKYERYHNTFSLSLSHWPNFQAHRSPHNREKKKRKKAGESECEREESQTCNTLTLYCIEEHQKSKNRSRERKKREYTLVVTNPTTFKQPTQDGRDPPKHTEHTVELCCTAWRRQHTCSKRKKTIEI